MNGWNRRWTVSLLVVASTAIGGSRIDAINSTTGKEFFYFLGGSFLSEHVDHVSVVHLEGNPAGTAAQLAALPHGIKAVVTAGDMMLTTNRCALVPDYVQRWATFSASVTPYLNKVAVFGLDDEPDLRARACYPTNPQNPNQPDPMGPEYMVRLMEQLSAVVKGTPGWPPVKTWVNYGTEFRKSGMRLAQNVDWSSFDCYGPFDNCGGQGRSIAQLVDLMAAKLPSPATQSIFLISDASCFLYDATGRKTHESELFLRGLEYWQLASTHPRVKGLVPFIWGPGSCNFLPPVDTINTISDSAGLSTLYRYIGLNLLTGAVPAISSLAVPAECVITSGSACTVNVSWTTTSGPNVGAFARLVGDADAVYGPLCPGATSCAVPAGVGDYIVELRENWADVNSKLIWARKTEVRYANGTPTGQITFTPSTCRLQGGHCELAFTANIQNAPQAGFFRVGAGAMCSDTLGSGRTNLCINDGAGLPLGGPYSFTVQLRTNWADPNSPLLAQKTISLTVTQ